MENKNLPAAVPKYEVTIQTELPIAESFLTAAKAMRITTPAQADAISADLKTIKDKIKSLNDERLGITRPMDESKDKIIALYNKPLTPLKEAASIYDNKLLTWTLAERARVKREEDQLRELAQAEENKKKAALEKKAEKAEAKGNTDKAEELRQKASEVYVPAPNLAPPPKTAGYSVVKRYDFEITDFAKLADKYKLENRPLIKKIVDAEKLSCGIEGIRVFEVNGGSSR